MYTNKQTHIEKKKKKHRAQVSREVRKLERVYILTDHVEVVGAFEEGLALEQLAENAPNGPDVDR